MGAWGTSFRESDDYYIELPAVVAPLIEQVSTHLCVAVGDDSYTEDYDALRRRTMTVLSILSGMEDIRIDTEHVEVLRRAADHIQAAAVKNSNEWDDPGELVRTANAEAAQIREWLSGFGPALPGGAAAVVDLINTDLGGQI